MSQHHKYHYFEKSQVSVGYKNPPEADPELIRNHFRGSEILSGFLRGVRRIGRLRGFGWVGDTSVGVDGSAAPS